VRLFLPVQTLRLADEAEARRLLRVLLLRFRAVSADPNDGKLPLSFNIIPRQRTRAALTIYAAVVAALPLLAPVRAAEDVRLSELSHIHGIAVNPQDPPQLILATHHGIFHASPEGLAKRVSNDANDYMGFTPHPEDSRVLFASGHPADGGNMGVIVSRDGGASWKELSPGADGPVDFHALDISRADPKTMYGLFGEVQASRDGGVSWEIAGSPDDEVFDLAASAITADTLFAATRAGLMVSRDGARTWQPTGPSGYPATMVYVGPDGSAYAFLLGLGLVKTASDSHDWETISATFGDRVLLHLAIDPSTPERMFAVTHEGPILVSTDGGRTWSEFPS
jgi:photosystem II stability/assembly factor-like uncharacterized protein